VLGRGSLYEESGYWSGLTMCHRETRSGTLRIQTRRLGSGTRRRKRGHVVLLLVFDKGWSRPFY